MTYQHNLNTHIKFICLFFFCLSAGSLYSESTLITPDFLKITFGGESTQETFSATNLNLLNTSIPEGSVGYIRSTFDSFVDLKYGENKEHPKLNFYGAVRFRFIWGSGTDILLQDDVEAIVDDTISIKGTFLNKHLLWMKESWLKFNMSADPSQQNFIQIGMIPFEVGRGISLGAAYDATGFLGFTSSYMIDQYAPAALLRLQLTKNSYFDTYFALLENNQTSMREILEPIRRSEINACPYRGIGRQSYIVTLRNMTAFAIREGQKWSIEPYFVHQQSPDKKFEFNNDVDTSISTMGAAIEAELIRVSWGLEGAVNFGDVYLKPWDRNKIDILRQSDGFLIEQYTKVYTQDPINVAAPLADVTTTNAFYVNASNKDVSSNGQQIGPNLFNAFDRFRPACNIALKGYFCVADFAYDYKPKVLKFGLGVGYASGFVHHQQDMNKLSSYRCMHQDFTGFIPLQSVYSGTRIRHFVMFNQEIPRFSVADLNFDGTGQNITTSMEPDAINAFTNIAFLGTRIAYNPERFKDHEVLLAPNIIAYWAPETSYTMSRPIQGLHPVIKLANNFLGTEINLEFNCKIVENLKIESYVGVLLPGSYYKDTCGTILLAYEQPIGNDLAYVGNFALTYTF